MEWRAGGGLRDRCPLTCCRRHCARASICCSATTLRFCALGILFRAGACPQQSRAAPSRASRSSTSSQATPGVREPVRIQRLLPRCTACSLASYMLEQPPAAGTSKGRSHMTLHRVESKLLPPSSIPTWTSWGQKPSCFRQCRGRGLVRDKPGEEPKPAGGQMTRL